MRPVIIIFGAAIRPDGSPSSALRSRVDAAVALGRTLERPLYMPTGGQGRFGPPEALVMRDLLLDAGIEPVAITPEPTGRNTIRSVRACVRLLLQAPDGAGAGPVYAATSAYHMLRCVMLLRLCGVDARAGRAPPNSASARWTRRWFWRLRELPAIPVDAAVMTVWRLQGRP